MSLDLAGATLAATKIVGVTNLAGVVKVPGKSTWDVHIRGAYDLIFPHLHQDIPTRAEVKKYVKACFQFHLNNRRHNGWRSRHGGSTPGFDVHFINSEAPGGAGQVRAIGDNVNSIGYGLYQ